MLACGPCSEIGPSKPAPHAPPPHACPATLCRDGYAWGSDPRLPGHFQLGFECNQHFAQVGVGERGACVHPAAVLGALPARLLAAALGSAPCLVSGPAPTPPNHTHLTQLSPLCSPTRLSSIWPWSGASCWDSWQPPSWRCAWARPASWRRSWRRTQRCVGVPQGAWGASGVSPALLLGVPQGRPVGWRRAKSAPIGCSVHKPDSQQPCTGAPPISQQATGKEAPDADDAKLLLPGEEAPGASTGASTGASGSGGRRLAAAAPAPATLCVWLSGVQASLSEGDLLEAFRQFGFPQKVGAPCLLRLHPSAASVLHARPPARAHAPAQPTLLPACRHLCARRHTW